VLLSLFEGPDQGRVHWRAERQRQGDGGSLS